MRDSPTLEQLAARWRAGLPLEAQGRLEHYLDLVEEWDRAHRLTGHRDRRSRWQGLVVESLALGLPLIEGAGRLVDLGSGNGAPGLVIALVAPRWEVFGIESRLHRYAFLKHAARELGAANFEVRRGRAERPAAGEAGSFDVAVARAFGPLGQAVALAGPYLGRGGWFLTMVEQGLPEGWRERFRRGVEVEPGVDVTVRRLERIEG